MALLQRQNIFYGPKPKIRLVIGLFAHQALRLALPVNQVFQHVHEKNNKKTIFGFHSHRAFGCHFYNGNFVGIVGVWHARCQKIFP